uniref:C-type lectin domain-containing protein n=1 Tax=Plectus sambesii TaxID=2011161 RepID=A0A914WLA3_9BILA
MMRLSVALLLATAIAGCLSASLPQKEEQNVEMKPLRKIMIHGRPIHGLVPTPVEENKPENKAATTPAYYTQKLDHFDNTTQRTFQQRYWYNPAYLKSGGPIFLMLGGEGPASSSWITTDSLYFDTMAKKYNAAMFELEHRYYGETRPTSDQSTSNLKWLSSRQAVEDTAAFIRAMNSVHQWTNPKWIVFGGSYSGALAAWMRQNYPDIVAGAVASSGPVFAKLDFLEYIDVVQTSLRTYSSPCADNIQAGFVQLQQMMATAAGRKQLSTTFSLCPAFGDAMPSDKDIQNFYDTVMGNFMYTVQYSQDNVAYFANELTIPAVCAKMTANNGKSNVQKLADVNTFVGGFFGGGCTGTSYNDFIKGMQSTSFNSPYADSRSWVWQTCTEFGYFQSTDQTNNIFGSTVPVSFYVDQCTAIYGSQFNQQTISQSVDSTDAFYGGRDNYKGTNVVLPNGSVDPWHALGILTTKGTATAALITGTAHCADMYPPRSADPPGLTQARITIDQKIASIMQPCPAGYSVVVQGNNNCYKLVSSAKAWQDAENQCVSEGGHLASVHNAFENAALSTFASAANSNANTWIGLNNMNSPTSFTWSDGSSTMYTNWANGQPMQPTAMHCVQQGAKGSSSPALWMTASCSMAQQFVCSINQ